MIAIRDIVEAATEMQNDYGYINWKGLIKHYGITEYQLHCAGGVKTLCQKYGFKRQDARRPDPSEIKADFLSVYRSYGYISKELYIRYGCYSIQSVRTAFGSVNKLMEELGIRVNMHRNVSKDDVVRDVKLFILETGSTSAREYRMWGKYSQPVIDRTCGGWRTLLDELGIGSKQKRYGKSYMLNELRRVYNQYGCVSKPLVGENCEFTYEAAAFAFGGKSGISLALGLKMPSWMLEALARSYLKRCYQISSEQTA